MAKKEVQKKKKKQVTDRDNFVNLQSLDLSKNSFDSKNGFSGMEIDSQISYNVDISNHSEKNESSENVNYQKDEINKLNRENYLFQSKKQLELEKHLNNNIYIAGDNYIENMKNIDQRSEESLTFENVSGIGLDHSQIMNNKVNKKIKKLALHPFKSEGVNLIKKNIIKKKKIKKKVVANKNNGFKLPFNDSRTRIKTFQPKKKVNLNKTGNLNIPKKNKKKDFFLSPNISYVKENKLTQTFMLGDNKKTKKKQNKNSFASKKSDHDSMDDNNHILQNLNNKTGLDLSFTRREFTQNNSKTKLEKNNISQNIFVNTNKKIDKNINKLIDDKNIINEIIDKNGLSINDESSDAEEDYNNYENDSSDFGSNKDYDEKEINIFGGNDHNFVNTEIETKLGKVVSKDKLNNLNNFNNSNGEFKNAEDELDEEYTAEKKISEVQPFSIYSNFMKRESEEKLEKKVSESQEKEKEEKITEKISEDNKEKKKPKYEISSNTNNLVIKKKKIYQISTNPNNVLIKKKSEKTPKTISDSSLKTISNEEEYKEKKQNAKIINREIIQAFSLIQMKNDISIDDSSDDESFSKDSNSDNSNDLFKNNEIENLDISNQENFKDGKNGNVNGNNFEIGKNNDGFLDSFGGKRNFDISQENDKKHFDDCLNNFSEKNDFEDLSDNFDSDLNEKFDYKKKDLTKKEKALFFKKLIDFIKNKEDMIKHKSFILLNFYDPDPKYIFINKIRNIMKKNDLQEKNFSFIKISKVKKSKKKKLPQFQNFILSIYRKKIFNTIRDLNKQYKYYKFLSAFSRIIKIYKYNILIDGFMRINYFSFLDHQENKTKNKKDQRNFAKKKQMEIYEDKNINSQNQNFIKKNYLEKFQSIKYSIKEIEENINIKKNPKKKENSFSNSDSENTELDENLYHHSFTQKNLYEKQREDNSEKESRIMDDVNDSVIDNSLCINSYLEKENKKINKHLKKKFETEESNIEIDLNDKIRRTHFNENVIGSSSEEKSGSFDIKNLVNGLKGFLENFKDTKNKFKNKKITDEILFLKNFMKNIKKKKKNDKMKMLLIEIIKILEKLIMKKKRYEKRKIYDDSSDSSESDDSYIEKKKNSKYNKL